jgi:putative sigma-54 modulation protein
MNISTTARHCELDPEDRLFAQQRLEKLARYVRDAREAHLILTAEKYRHTAEITLKLKNREMLSREHSTQARMAIDLAADRLEQQLRRLKEKRVDRKQRPANGRANGRTVPEGAPEEDFEADLADEE